MLVLAAYVLCLVLNVLALFVRTVYLDTIWIVVFATLASACALYAQLRICVRSVQLGTTSMVTFCWFRFKLQILWKLLSWVFANNWQMYEMPLGIQHFRWELCWLQFLCLQLFDWHQLLFSLQFWVLFTYSGSVWNTSFFMIDNLY